MRRRECTETERLDRLETLTAEDQRHVSSCRSCTEYMTVSSAMSALAIEPAEAASRMPSAQMVFLRARIASRKRLATESARPLMAFQRLASAIIAVCWIAFLAMQWTPFTHWLSGIQISPADGIHSSGSLPLSFFWMFAALSLMTMTTMIHGFWTEDLA